MPSTTPSTSPVTERLVFPYEVVNPQSKASNVLAIVERVIHAPIPEGYREIDDVMRARENNPKHAAALARARQRLAAQLDGDKENITIATLRLRAGLSQAKVAELLGNSQSSYSLIESGKRTEIFHSTYEKLVDIFKVSRDELSTAIANTKENSL